MIIKIIACTVLMAFIITYSMYIGYCNALHKFVNDLSKAGLEILESDNATDAEKEAVVKLAENMFRNAKKEREKHRNIHS